MTPRHPVSEVIPATEEHPRVEVVRSARRRRTVTAQPADDGSIRLLVPDISTDEQIRGYLADLLPKVQRTRRRAQGKRRHFASDEYLLSRAQYLVEQYLPELSGKVPESIRWVSNQRTRWGSATPGAGRIRISDALTGAPEYVVDAVCTTSCAILWCCTIMRSFTGCRIVFHSSRRRRRFWLVSSLPARRKLMSTDPKTSHSLII